jgi:hypothetical protein
MSYRSSDDCQPQRRRQRAQQLGSRAARPITGCGLRAASVLVGLAIAALVCWAVFGWPDLRSHDRHAETLRRFDALASRFEIYAAVNGHMPPDTPPPGINGGPLWYYLKGPGAPTVLRQEDDVAVGPSHDRFIRDAWGRPFQYTRGTPPADFGTARLWSTGADGVSGTDDDIVSWRGEGGHLWELRATWRDRLRKGGGRYGHGPEGQD